MTETRTPFASRLAKPQVTRLPDGRIGVFMGSAYQFTDDAGARSLRDQLDDVLQVETPTGALVDGDFCKVLHRELESVAAGGCAPPVLASKVDA
jgi:hypothetical protein